MEFRPGQRQAANALLQGCDVPAVLPTGFGTNLIFQPFAVTARSNSKESTSNNVGCLPIISAIIQQSKVQN